jgi:predicted nucleotidyltransferase
MILYLADGADSKMSTKMNVQLPRDKVADFCRKNRIRKLSLFGSALKGAAREDSDGDLLVEFQPGDAPSLLDLARMERELTTLLGGRKVDLRTPNELSRYFRQEVLSTASVQYAEG